MNGEGDDFRDESVTALLERRGVEPRGVAVAVDGEIVVRSKWDTRVPDGSNVEIVTAAAGG